MFDTSNPCQGKRQFDQDASSTYKKDGRSFDLPFGLGNVSGILGMDTVILGDPKSGQVSIPETIFAQAQTLAYEFGKLPLDGMLGLAYQSVSIDNVAPVFQVNFKCNIKNRVTFLIMFKNIVFSLQTFLIFKILCFVRPFER